ncbi:MAG: DUF1553 domain-containing protein [Candidatus Omnitrophica bacterium]|nr:DUF1553 domain-containing protein [Candidatus Omnitrophota bacterium]
MSQKELARKARSILSENCFACHGPDKNKRKAGMRLDTEEGLHESGVTQPVESGPPELIYRILSEDPSEVMPPPKAHKKPTQEEREILRQWVEAGAPYEGHWAFQPIERTTPPDVNNPEGWDPTPIDSYILNRLQEKGLEPSPMASKEKLIRRVSLDLTGLPPTLSEIDEFLNDDSPNAYERVVDRLLASPAYGERMANHWLDLARYADTYGYQNDRENRVWPWRDWLIRAFNKNQPYDQFVTWQLAGDLIPGATQDAILATAFNRLHRQTNEGGSVLEEFRVEYVADRTRTFGTTFLGMTFECARCHDHKFDPITQKDYYELTAFFANIDESGMYAHFTNAVPSPSLILYGEGERQKHQDLKDRIAGAEENLERTAIQAEDRFRDWLADEYRPVPSPDPVSYLPLDVLEATSTEDSTNPGYLASLSLDPKTVEGMKGEAAEFSGDNSISINHAGKFERTDPFSFSLWVKVQSEEPRQVVFHRSQAAEDAGSRGYELLLLDGHPAFSLVHFWPGNAIRVQSKEKLELERWTHLSITYDGSSRAEGVRIFIDGEESPLEVERDGLFKTIRYTVDGLDPPLTLAARFRDFGFKDGIIDEFKVYDRELNALEVRALATRHDLKSVLNNEISSLHAGEEDPDLSEYYLSAVDMPYADAMKAARDQREAEEKYVEGLSEIMVMKEMPEPRTTYVLNRGEYSNHGEEVTADTPPSILPFPSDLPRNRLGLAKWLFRPDNPLTARVAVNQFWQIFFGKGLVKTSEDFGNQGSVPTHPELLDYLASEFRNSGWDMKALCKRIVMSSTYRQDSTPSPELREKDPGNEWLARGPKQRLSAEQIRDSALAASGLLVEKIGGPSVKPYQPEGLWRDSSSVEYHQDEGDALHRRSMYTFIKRTVPPPMMTTFDATNREVCIARREITSTPLQALVILNDPQFVEAARVLAEKALAGEQDLDGRLERVFRTLTSREPDPKEREILRAAYQEQRDYFSEHPKEADGYVQEGEAPVPEDLDKVELAALTAVAQLGMNYEEFQVKQ